MSGKGFGLLWRKFFDHEFWKEPRVLSRAEAWIDIVFCLARGTTDTATGLKRGEFRASLTWLSARWSWDKTRVQRFMAQLTAGEDPMLTRLPSEGVDIRAYKVCKFDKYQNLKRETPSDTPSETPRATPVDTPKPAEVLAFTPPRETLRETPDETLSETPSETKRKERINTVRERVPDSRHRDFVGWLLETNPAVVITQADHRSLKELLSQTRESSAYSLENLKRYWNAFQAHGDDFDRKQGASVKYFASRINRFVRLADTRATRKQEAMPL